MAGSSSSGRGPLSGPSPNDNPYQMLYGVAIMSKNTFLQLDVPSESSSEGMRRKGPGARRREHSTPPSISNSSTCGNEEYSSNKPLAAITVEPPAESDEGEDCADTGEAVDEQAEGADVTAQGGKRIYNLCKNKRIRIRNFEVKVKEQIVENPNLDVDGFPYPAFLNVSPEVLPKMKDRLREFQQSVLAGANPDPSYRHPSTKNVQKAASSSPQKGRRNNNLVSL